MVELTKHLANRHQCLKWMYNQGNISFVQRDVISKFHIPTTFLAACAKKNILKADINGTKYIGPEPDVKLAVELFDFENQCRGKHVTKYPKKMVDVEKITTKKPLTQIIEENTSGDLGKLFPEVTSVKQNGFILPLELSVKDGKVSMSWKDFNKLVEVYGTSN